MLQVQQSRTLSKRLQVQIEEAEESDKEENDRKKGFVEGSE